MTPIIAPYGNEDSESVITLILSIQQKEFGVAITADDQPDLKDIPNFYQRGTGNFWVAKDNGKVVGTISLLDIGAHQVALRKMFVHPDYRGAAKGVAQMLLQEAITWARAKKVKTIFLGTTDKFLAAHRFYEKNGFSVLPKEQLPAAFPVMKVDSRFYQLHIA
jgi:N-acetylglutamate synthase-like GNAT family acetyltransferase